MNKEIGYLEGERCNRDGCCGIIEAYPKEGCCSCHINSPCSYCTTPTEYCPICGWDAREEQEEHDKYLSSLYKPIVTHVWKSSSDLFDELKDDEFGYVHLDSEAKSVTRVKGKHPNMGISEIYKRLGLSENPNMPRMKHYSDKTFELTYFND